MAADHNAEAHILEVDVEEPRYSTSSNQKQEKLVFEEDERICSYLHGHSEDST